MSEALWRPTTKTSNAIEHHGEAFARGGWIGHWISAAPRNADDPAAGLGGLLPPQSFSRVLLRTTVDLDSVPDTVPARLAADSRYALFVNGHEVGRGPIRSQPRRMNYDSYDLAEYLSTGENVISALVTYYGAANAFWQPAAGTAPLGTDAAFVFEARLGDQLLVSDSSWRATRSTAWSVFDAHEIDGVPVDRVDAAAIPIDWNLCAFDDSDWEVASILSTAHIGGFARSQPPTDPYGAMVERSVGLLGGTVVDTNSPGVSTRAGIVRRGPWRSDHPADRALQVLESRQDASLSATRLPTGATLGATDALLIELDFGRIVAGYTDFEVDAPPGTVLDFYYRERPYDVAAADSFSAPRGGLQYVTRGNTDEYTSLELHGLRYLYLVVHAMQGADVTVSRLGVREHTYQWRGEAGFSCSDDAITALYRAGIRTVQLNSFDAFTDCPTREQRSWVGDGVVHQMVHLTTNDDWRLARRYVELGDSPRPDGILPMSVVGEIESNGGVTIPDWSLHWVHGVFNLHRYRGDQSETLGYLPTIEGILRWYAAYIDEHGTISDVPEWNLVDWSSVFSTGRSSILTALWARGLDEYAQLCRFVGNTASAVWAEELWESARIGFEDFWDEERGTYIDHIVNGQPKPAASQAAGASAIVSRLAPESRWERIARTITDPNTVVIRSWIGGEHGGYDFEKMEEQSRGVQRIDWDAEREIVRAQPFFSYVVHDAVAQAGLAGNLVTLMRDWSQFFQGGYDTFGECWGWGTPVHGWSSTPTRDLVQYVLGVTPHEPGFSVARIAPRLGGLEWVEGIVPTPFGLIKLRITTSEVRLTSPVPVVVELEEGTTINIDSGHHVLALNG